MHIFLFKKRNFCYLKFALLLVITIIINSRLSIAANSFDVREVCESKNGVWREFGDDCADNCVLESRKGRMICAPEITYSCQCPKNQCWDYYRCVDNKEYQAEASKAEAERITELKKTNPEFFIYSKASNDQRINKEENPEETQNTNQTSIPSGTVNTTSKTNNQNKDNADQTAQCKSSGGVWKEFSNACADNCSNKKYPSLCISTVTQSCDCPDDKCWNGSSCIPLSSY